MQMHFVIDNSLHNLIQGKFEEKRWDLCTDTVVFAHYLRRLQR